MHPAIAPGIVTGDGPVSLWPTFFPIPTIVTVPVISAQLTL